MRVVSAQEAYGTIAAIPFWGRSHAVTTLPAHGPGQQMMVFVDGEDPEALIDSNRSKLMGYFDRDVGKWSTRKVIDHVVQADVQVTERKVVDTESHRQVLDRHGRSRWCCVLFD